jgi:hypothetical protein
MVYHLPTRETNFRYPFPFAASKRKFAVSVLRLQQTNRSYPFANGLNRLAHLFLLKNFKGPFTIQ